MKKVRIKSSAEKGRCDGGSEDGYRWIWILSRMVNAPSRFCTGERLDRGRGEAKGIILSFPGPKIWLRLGTMKGAGGSHDDMRREGKLDPELLARNALDGAWDGQLIPGKKKMSWLTTPVTRPNTAGRNLVSFGRPFVESTCPGLGPLVPPST